MSIKKKILFGVVIAIVAFLIINPDIAITIINFLVGLFAVIFGFAK